MDRNSSYNAPEYFRQLLQKGTCTFLKTTGYSYRQWREARKAYKDKRMVIRIVEGGNEYMSVGDSKSGSAVVFPVIGWPIVLEYPRGYYQSTPIEWVQWEDSESGTIKTRCSIYHFHFCKD